MSDGIVLPTTGTGTATPVVSTEEVTTLNGGAVTAQHLQRLILALRTADATAVDAPGDATYGVDVDVARSALPSGAATSAKQDTQQTTLDAVAATLAGGEPFGTNDELPPLPGDEATIQARLRLMTSQLDAIREAVETLAEALIEPVRAQPVSVESLPARDALTDSITARLATDALQNGLTPLTPKFAAIAGATNGDNTLVAGVATKKLRVLAMVVVSGAAGNLYFTSGAGGSVIFGGSANKIVLAAASALFALQFCPVGWFETLAGQALVMNASSTGPWSGGVVYAEV